MSVVVVSGVQEVTKYAIYQRTVHNQKAFMNEVIKATKQKPTAEITKLLMVLCAGVFGHCVVEGFLEGEPQMRDKAGDFFRGTKLKQCHKALDGAKCVALNLVSDGGNLEKEERMRLFKKLMGLDVMVHAMFLGKEGAQELVLRPADPSRGGSGGGGVSPTLQTLSRDVFQMRHQVGNLKERVESLSAQATVSSRIGWFLVAEHANPCFSVKC